MNENDQGLITAAELSRATGLSRSTLFRARRTGALASQRVAGRVFYSRSAVDAFLAMAKPSLRVRHTGSDIAERIATALEMIAVAGLMAVRNDWQLAALGVDGLHSQVEEWFQKIQTVPENANG